MRPAGLLILLLLAACVVLFVFFPRVDLVFSGLFYDDGFHLRDHPVVVFLHRFAGYPGNTLGVAGLLLWLAALVLRRASLLGMQRRVGLFLALALVLGPGLAVNGVLKDHWGRARPVHVQEFGGEREFTPALVIADQCHRNCAFTSGHAAVAFYLLVPAFLLTGFRRRVMLVIGLTWGTVVGMGRIVQGGHFLSDVVFSLIVVYLVAALLHRLMFGRSDGTSEAVRK
jgi:lipid A 4'-phosphatase